VRASIENEVRGQLAQKRFSDAAVEFGDLVYEQADSLKPAADRLKLEIRKVEHVKRVPVPGATGALASTKFLDALFASDVTKDKRNTKAIDVGANQLAAGRAVQYAPEHALALADVKDKVRQKLVATQATALARKLGVERLAAARAAPSVALSDVTQIVSRAEVRDLPRALLDAVLTAPAASLPTFVGVDLGDQGYAIARITKLWGRDPKVSDPVQAKAQYAQVWGDAEAQAYYAALKARYKVTTTPSALMPSDAASAPLR
jgi:peptidyl-prolyl cis-trans isomerase D